MLSQTVLNRLWESANRLPRTRMKDNRPHGFSVSNMGQWEQEPDVRVF